MSSNIFTDSTERVASYNIFIVPNKDISNNMSMLLEQPLIRIKTGNKIWIIEKYCGIPMGSGWEWGGEKEIFKEKLVPQ